MHFESNERSMHDSELATVHQSSKNEWSNHKTFTQHTCQATIYLAGNSTPFYPKGRHSKRPHEFNDQTFKNILTGTMSTTRISSPSMTHHCLDIDSHIVKQIDCKRPVYSTNALRRSYDKLQKPRASTHKLQQTQKIKWHMCVFHCAAQQSNQKTVSENCLRPRMRFATPTALWTENATTHPVLKPHLLISSQCW